VAERAAEYRKKNGLPSDSLVPADAVTTSGSGLDPHISPRNAQLQAQRVATARGLKLDEVQNLIARHTQGRDLFVLGEPRVNVVTLNLALDERH
jgi:K+-transporting ATPase ATPase C chain